MRVVRTFCIDGELHRVTVPKVGDRVINNHGKKGTVKDIEDGGLFVIVKWDDTGIMGSRWLAHNIKLLTKE